MLLFRILPHTHLSLSDLEIYKNSNEDSYCTCTFNPHTMSYILRKRCNSYTYIPALGSSFFLLQEKNIWVHNVHEVNKIEINHKIHNMCSHLLLASLGSFCFLCLAEVLQYYIIKAYTLDFNYTHVSWPSTYFNTLFLMNRGEIEEQYLHPWVSMSLWLPATQILVKHNLTHLSRCWLITPSPKFYVTTFPASSLVAGVHGYL